MDEVVGCTRHDKGQKWQGMMTLPRELKIKDGKIWQSPVRELEKYKKKSNHLYRTEKLADRCLWMVSMAG